MQDKARLRLHGRLAVGRWLDSIGIHFWEVPSSDGSRKYFFNDGCLFDPSHTGKDACILQLPDGKTLYKCFHDSCSERRMVDVYEKHGRPADSFYEAADGMPSSSRPERQSRSSARWRAEPEVPAWQPQPKKYLDFVNQEFVWDWVIPDVLLAGQNLMIAGPEKCLKTTVCIELMLSIASGEPFLGQFPIEKQGPVMFISGESGESVLWETTRRIAKAKGISLEADLPLYYESSLPTISNPHHIDLLRELIVKLGLQMVVVDPAYLALLAAGEGVNTADNMAMGPLLKRYGDLNVGTNCVMGLIHHATKGRSEPGDDIELADMAGAGFREYARQWLLLRRRERFVDAAAPHSIALQIGGAAGQNSKWALRAIEWDGSYLPNGKKSPRIWHAELKSWSEEEMEKEADKLRSDEEVATGIRQQLLAHVQLAAGPISRNSLRLKVKGNTEKILEQIDRLVRDGAIRESTVDRGAQSHRYYSPGGEG